MTHTPPPSEVVRFAEELSQRGLTCRAGTAARILAVVALTEREWSDEVSAAAIAGDRAALMRLFRQAQDLFGEEASHKWSEAMSGLDANAQTG